MHAEAQEMYGGNFQHAQKQVSEFSDSPHIDALHLPRGSLAIVTISSAELITSKAVLIDLQG